MLQDTIYTVSDVLNSNRNRQSNVRIISILSIMKTVLCMAQLLGNDSCMHSILADSMLFNLVGRDITNLETIIESEITCNTSAIRRVKMQSGHHWSFTCDSAQAPIGQPIIEHLCNSIHMKCKDNLSLQAIGDRPRANSSFLNTHRVLL